MKNLAASVLARLKNRAKELDLVYNDILIRFAIERVLKRLERSSYAGNCILKGGTLFIVWNGGFSYRPTMDADLEFRGDGSPENLKAVFDEVARMPGEEEDGLRIDADSVHAVPIRDDDQYGGVRVTMMALIGTVRIPVQIDVGIGDAITPVAKKGDFPVLLDFEAPRLKIYPRETVIAEKYQTIVKRGLANSRMKDYYDLWKLSEDPKVDLDLCRQAIARTFERRETPLPSSVPEGLSDAFANDESKLKQWHAFLRKNRLSCDGLSLADLVSRLRDFLLSSPDSPQS